MTDDCPRCGCNDVRLLARKTITGRAFKSGKPDAGVAVEMTRSTYLCGFCGRRFTVRTDWQPIAPKP